MPQEIRGNRGACSRASTTTRPLGNDIRYDGRSDRIQERFEVGVASRWQNRRKEGGRRGRRIFVEHCVEYRVADRSDAFAGEDGVPFGDISHAYTFDDERLKGRKGEGGWRRKARQDSR